MCCLGLLSILPQNLAAQQGPPGRGSRPSDTPKPKIAEVQGVVIDADSGLPMPFVSVVILSAKDSTTVAGTLTGEDGHFHLTEVEVGRHLLNIRFPGYKTLWLGPAMLGPRPPGVLVWETGTLRLESDITALEEAVVVEQATVMEMRVDRKVFYVGSDLTSRGGNTNDLLENIPSVAVDIDGNITLRGSAGVQILIDGRPSGLSGGAREAFLESLPASAVDRIELITNPSARFDPDGTAGILNIVLKKNRLEGISGQLQATYGSGDNHDANASLNYRNSMWSVSSNVGWNDQWMFMAGETDRIQQWSNDSTSESHVMRPGDSHRSSLTGSVRTEWRPQETWTLFAGINGNQGLRNSWDSTTTSEIWTGGALDGVTTEALRHELGDSDSRGGDVFLGFEKQWGERDHKWTFDIRKSVNIQTGENHFTDVSLSQNIPEVFTFNGQRADNQRWLYQTDVELPWGEQGKVEFGAKSTWNQDQTDFTYTEADSTELVGGIFQPWGLDTVNYAFFYDEQVHAGYITAGQTLGPIGMQVGLRAEQVFTSARLDGEGSLGAAPFDNDYFRLYPSLNLFMETNDEHTFSVSYSRRVNRPRGRQLNPYVDMSDPRNFRSGNPFLLPEFTNSYELNHQWQRGKTSLTTSLFFKDTRDVISRFTSSDSLTGVLTSNFQNLGRQHNEGLEMVVMVPFGTTGRLNWTASAFRVVNDGRTLDSPFSSAGFSTSSRLFASWTVGKSWKMQANGFLRGPSVTAQGRFHGMATLNVAASRDLPGEKWQITLQIKDVLNTRRWSYNTETTSFSQEVWRQRESRNAFITLQYKFGKMEERNRRGSRGGDSGGDSGGGDDFMFD
ncbi:MAG: outer membrane beta-barrel family protein [Bacteroidetes bacterium]|nr:outer membrane beta-barrel family protein [Bacteroidota bacterium]MDA1242270.1 outer membrane beta-barrel family protein [Bacteroidota bacterium]